MTLLNTFVRLTAAAPAVIALAMLTTPVDAQSGGTFAGLAGNWSGTGTIFVADGGSERIRCRATYTVAPDGSTLQQNLRCASDSYKFELATDIRSSGSSVSGIWSETSRGVHGTLEGRGGNGEFNVLVSGEAFSAELSLKVSGGKQSIVMSSKNTDLRGLNINLSRS